MAKDVLKQCLFSMLGSPSQLGSCDAQIAVKSCSQLLGGHWKGKHSQSVLYLISTPGMCSGSCGSGKSDFPHSKGESSSDLAQT